MMVVYLFKRIIFLISLLPYTQQTGDIARDIATLSMELNVYNNESYTNKLTESDFPFSVDIMDHVYFELEVMTSNPTIKLAPQDCFATQVQNSESSNKHYILKDTCPVDRTFLSTLDTYKLRFSIQAFIWQNQNSSVYLHCESLICLNNSNDTECTYDTGCSRKKRDILKQQQQQNIIRRFSSNSNQDELSFNDDDVNGEDDRLSINEIHFIDENNDIYRPRRAVRQHHQIKHLASTMMILVDDNIGNQQLSKDNDDDEKEGDYGADTIIHSTQNKKGTFDHANVYIIFPVPTLLLSCFLLFMLGYGFYTCGRKRKQQQQIEEVKLLTDDDYNLVELE